MKLGLRLILLSVEKVVAKTNWKTRVTQVNGRLILGIFACSLVFGFGSKAMSQQNRNLKQAEKIYAKWDELKTTKNKSIGVARFIGFLEGSLNVEVPPQWFEIILTAVSSDSEIDFSLQHVEPRRKRQEALRKVANRQTDIPDEYNVPKHIKDRVSSYGCIEFCVEGELLYLLALRRGGLDGELVCIDLKNGKEKWAIQTTPKRKPEDAKVILGTGISLGSSFVTTNDSLVVVFSWKPEFARVLVYDRESGSEKIRFVLKPIQKE